MEKNSKYFSPNEIVCFKESGITAQVEEITHRNNNWWVKLKGFPKEVNSNQLKRCTNSIKKH